MKERNKKQIRLFNITSDAVLVFLSYLLAMWLFYNVLGGEITVNPFEGRFLFAIAVLSIVMSVAYQAVHTHYGNMILVTMIGTLLLMAMFFVYRVTEFSRMSLVIFFLFSCATVIGKHALGHSLISDHYAKRKAVIIGNGRLAEKCAEDTGYSVYSTEDQIPEDTDEIIIALEPQEADKVTSILSFADKEGLYVSMVPFFSEYIPPHPEIESIGDSKLINLRATPLDNVGNAAIKRLVDIICSALLVIILSPMMIITAVGVKLSSPGPVLFKQDRVGKDKKTFKMYKFRSMKVNSTQDTAWSTNKDDRRTPFGSFIRKYSIDEIPQFFNVLFGDMSLVGPRPEIPFYVHQFKETIPLYLVRQQVRPGITGWAQVNDLRGDTSIEERVKYDIYYIENWSLLFDIKILFKTIFGGKFKNSET